MKSNIVIDTNVLLVSIPSKSIYRPIFQALLDNKYNLVVSNEIISEYAEIIGLKANKVVSDNFIDNLLVLPNVIKVDVFYKWELIKNDADDNKFVDCALAGNAKLLVSNDRHFNVLKEIDFPKLECIEATNFLEKLKNKNI